MVLALHRQPPCPFFPASTRRRRSALGRGADPTRSKPKDSPGNNHRPTDTVVVGYCVTTTILSAGCLALPGESFGLDRVGSAPRPRAAPTPSCACVDTGLWMTGVWAWLPAWPCGLLGLSQMGNVSVDRPLKQSQNQEIASISALLPTRKSQIFLIPCSPFPKHTSNAFEPLQLHVCGSSLGGSLPSNDRF